LGLKKARICLPVGRQVRLLVVWKNKFETLTNKEYNRAGQACGFYCFFRADLPYFIYFFIFYYLHKGGFAASFTYKIARKNIIFIFHISKQSEPGQGPCRITKNYIVLYLLQRQSFSPGCGFWSGIF
jgi:hypothetical protein